MTTHSDTIISLDLHLKYMCNEAYISVELTAKETDQEHVRLAEV